MTLKHGRGITSTFRGHTTTFILDEPTEESNLEETHYLLVHVEKMKKKMLGKTEGEGVSNLDESEFNIMVDGDN